MARLFIKTRMLLPSADADIHRAIVARLQRVRAFPVRLSDGEIVVEEDRDVSSSYHRDVMAVLERFVDAHIPAGCVIQLSESDSDYVVFGATEEARADALHRFSRECAARRRADAVALLAEAEKLDKMSPYIVTRVSASDVSNHVVWDRMRPDESTAAQALGIDLEGGDRVYVSWAMPVSSLVGEELPDPPDEDDEDDEGDGATARFL